MAPQVPARTVDPAGLDDAALVAQARAGRSEAFREITRRCNQRLFRVARSIVHDDAEAEDVVQAAYVAAFEHLSDFRGEAALATWLTRIVLNEGNGRLRARKSTVALAQLETLQGEGGRVIAFPARFGSEDPAADAARSQVRRLLERAVDGLPEPFRVVFVLRQIEECSVEDTAASLGLKPETVKTRLHRARRLLRAALHDTLAETLSGAFPFLGTRCDRMTQSVLARVASRLHGDDRLATMEDPTC